MNRVIISGNLSSEVELRFTANNTPVATFNVAVQRINDGVDFLPVIVWREPGENCKKYLTKGSKVLIEGKIQTRTSEYKDKKHYYTEIIADRVEYLSKPTNAPQNENKAPIKEDINLYEEFGKQVELDMYKDDGLPF